MGQVTTNSLIAVAALGELTRATAAWNSLLSEIPFEHLPNSAIRAMPQIYLNIKSSELIMERPRLRGVYRASWSNNAMRFAASQELFLAFNQHGINYRVIKGGAISALVGHWGLRRMGDLDVVVAPESEPKAAVLLRELSFTQQIPEGPKSSSHAKAKFCEGPWVNELGAVLDFHSIRGRPQIFSDLFQESGQFISLTGTPLHIPSMEMTAAISIWHGKKATAATDTLQTMLDLGSVLQKQDLSRLKILLLRSGILNTGQDFFSQLEQLQLVSGDSVAEWGHKSPRERVILSAARLRDSKVKIRRVSRFPQILRRRRLSSHQKSALRHNADIQGLMFRFWSVSGQLRPLERIIHTRFGGFGYLEKQGGPIPERDFRVTISARKSQPSRLQLHFTFKDSEYFHPFRALFINGIAHGLVPIPGNEGGIYEVTPDHDFVEISARCYSNENLSEVTNFFYSWISD